VNDLFLRAESILDVASAPGANSDGTVILMDRAGQLRVMSLEGWTLPALISEFGAREVYMVRKRAETITVEGWSVTDRCTMSRAQNRPTFAGRMPLHSAGGYAATSQVTPQLAR
jgi:hypothetical protein